jgi:hypothetical protein
MSSVGSVQGEATRTDIVPDTGIHANANADKNLGIEMIMLKNISKVYYGNNTNRNNNKANNSRSSSTVSFEHIVLDNLNLRIT